MNPSFRIALFLSLLPSTLFAFACGGDSADTRKGGPDAAVPSDATTPDDHATSAPDDGSFDGGAFDGTGAHEPEGGSMADAQPDVDAGAAVVGTLGDPCAPVGALGCAGHAQKGQLICGVDHRWASNGVCAGAMNCDTEQGSNAGSCQPIAPGCLGLAPGDRFCADGGVASQCGPDLVSRVDTVCSGTTGVCVNGGCVSCSPVSPAFCAGNQLETCDDAGTLIMQNCQFECFTTPDARCADCAEGTFRCLDDAGIGVQVCVNGSWEEPEAVTCSSECVTTNWHVVDGVLSSSTSPYHWKSSSTRVENQTTAADDCANLKGIFGYRLPSVQELQSILFQVGTCNPAVDQGPFGDTTPGPNWTYETFTNDAGAFRVRTVDMTTGAVSDADPSENLGSRCLAY
jgi:hypothetical protein